MCPHPRRCGLDRSRSPDEGALERTKLIAVVTAGYTVSVQEALSVKRTGPEEFLVRLTMPEEPALEETFEDPEAAVRHFLELKKVRLPTADSSGP